MRHKSTQRDVERLQALCESLHEEVEHLEAQCRDLQHENEKLRREATLVRLYRDVVEHSSASAAPPDDPPRWFEVPDTIPEVAPDLYRSLPPTFALSTFFEAANDLEISKKASRQCLLYFMKQQLLAQKGKRFHKDRTSRS